MNIRTSLAFALIFAIGSVVVCDEDLVTVSAPDAIVRTAVVEEYEKPIETKEEIPVEFPVYIETEPAVVECLSATIAETPDEAMNLTEDYTEEVSEPDKTIDISDQEIELLALLTMAEAEGECEEGKRLVIDTVLNRVDSKYFPNTIHDVIYQRYQFTSMTNGRSDRCKDKVTDKIRELVREEALSRTNSDVVFFQAGCYSRYGVPMFQVGNHYFSSYK